MDSQTNFTKGPVFSFTYQGGFQIQQIVSGTKPTVAASGYESPLGTLPEDHENDDSSAQNHRSNEALFGKSFGSVPSSTMMKLVEVANQFQATQGLASTAPEPTTVEVADVEDAATNESEVTFHPELNGFEDMEHMVHGGSQLIPQFCVEFPFGDEIPSKYTFAPVADQSQTHPLTALDQALNKASDCSEMVEAKRAFVDEFKVNGWEALTTEQT